MVSVGIRELRQGASDLLRRVERGETIEITDRGRPVAMLVPPPDGSALDRLRAAGGVESADGGLDELPPPLALPRGTPRPSEVLRRLREVER